MQDMHGVSLTRSLGRARRIARYLLEDLANGDGGWAGTAFLEDDVPSELRRIRGVWIYRVRVEGLVAIPGWECRSRFPIRIMEEVGRYGRPELNDLPPPDFVDDERFLALKAFGRGGSLDGLVERLVREWSDGPVEDERDVGSILERCWTPGHRSTDWKGPIRAILGTCPTDDERRVALKAWLEARFASLRADLRTMRSKGRHKLQDDVRYNRQREKSRVRRSLEE